MIDPITPQESSVSEQSPPYRWVLLAFGALFIARLLGAYNIYFLEEDEISLAAGIAALVRDNVGDLYRYTPQIGYYRIMEWIDLALGGDVSRIPSLMKLWSVAAGALIPALGLVMFRDRLTLRERWLLVAAMAISPILWRSSQYGNTAMASLFFVAIGVSFLSNRTGVWGRVAGLAAVGLAVFVRADAILVLPLVAYLLYVRMGTIRSTVGWLAGFGVTAGTVALVTYLVDPRLDSAAEAVAFHMSNFTTTTRFWTFSLWAISPVGLALAVPGLWALRRRPVLLVTVLLGVLGPVAFYANAMTTPRYFLLAVIPLSIAIAVGMETVALWLGARVRPALAWAAVGLIGTAHLFVGFDQIGRRPLKEQITNASISTHDGPMPTGALLYDTYLRGGFLWQSYRNPGFGQDAYHWQGVTFKRALAEAKARPPEGQTILLLFDAGWDHVFHFYAQEEGATYVSRAPGDPSVPFASETWLRVGDVSLMTIRFRGDAYSALSRLPVEVGDEIWITGRNPFPDASVLEKLPEGWSLAEGPTFDDRIRVFQISGGSA